MPPTDLSFVTPFLNSVRKARRLPGHTAQKSSGLVCAQNSNFGWFFRLQAVLE